MGKERVFRVEQLWKSNMEDPEKLKMLAGELYHSFGPTLTAERKRCRDLLRAYNATTEEQNQSRFNILEILLGSFPADDPPLIEPPIYCDYGQNIHVGASFYANFNCTLLDCASITIGDRVLLGCNVQLLTPGHPLDPAVRNGLAGPEFAKKICIGSDCWIGAGATILGGVTVGDGCTVGAASVVTKDVPPFSVVAGNPARIIRKLDQQQQQGIASTNSNSL